MAWMRRSGRRRNRCQPSSPGTRDAAVAGRHRQTEAALASRVHIGDGQSGNRVCAAIEWQLCRQRLQHARKRFSVGVEQAVGINAMQVVAAVLAQRRGQPIAGEVLEHLGALQQRGLRELVQVQRYPPVQHPQQHARPGHEQQAVQPQQAAAGRTPAVRQFR
ncbi:hypothetical protein G6F46_013247 [Rhizopus delemar]|nr:hypothetical protein G6F46_013247 [Rhizopus delemar]